MKVLVAGIGHICRLHYLKWILTSPLVTSVCLYDPYQDIRLLQELVNELEALSDRAIDVILSRPSQAFEAIIHEYNPAKVLVLTNNTSHFELARNSLEYGVDVLIEKPVTLNLHDFKLLQALATKNNALLFPAYHQFFRSETTEALHKLHLHKGTDAAVDILIQSGSGSHYPSHSLSGGFRKIELAGGGVLLDLGSHYLSLALLLLDALGRPLDLSHVIIRKALIGFLPSRTNTDVECTFTALIGNTDSSIDLSLSYIESKKTLVSVSIGGQTLVEWPHISISSSKLAFKAMLDYFLTWTKDDNSSLNMDDHRISHTHLIPTIFQTVGLIELLYDAAVETTI